MEGLENASKNFNDDELSTLVLYVSSNTRGGFKDLKSFEDFIKMRPNGKDGVSKFVTKLETFATSVGYFYGHHIKQQNNGYIEQILTKLGGMSDWIVPHINDEVVDKCDELVYGDIDQDECTIIEPVDYMSDASDVEEGEKKPPHRFGASKFLLKKGGSLSTEGGFFSTVERFFSKKGGVLSKEGFAHNATRNKIPIRSHVSGSMPLVLATMGWLLSHQENGPLDGVRTNLITSLTIAAFQRADFHTYIETLAGSEYFFKLKFGDNNNDGIRPSYAIPANDDELLDPIKLLERSLETIGLGIDATNNEVVKDYNRIKLSIYDDLDLTIKTVPSLNNFFDFSSHDVEYLLKVRTCYTNCIIKHGVV